MLKLIVLICYIWDPSYHKNGHVKIHIIQLDLSAIAPDAKIPANHRPRKKILLDQYGF